MDCGMGVKRRESMEDELRKEIERTLMTDKKKIREAVKYFSPAPEPSLLGIKGYAHHMPILLTLAEQVLAGEYVKKEV
jgi:hypothetical protein